MDFSFSEDQLAIRELAYQIFTDRTTDEFLLAFSRTDATYDDELWKTLAEQGLLGVAVPESAGGTGLGLVELCQVLEEQGRRVAPVPLISNLVLGGLPLTEFGNEQQQARWLTPLAAGEVKLTAALAELGMTAALATTVTATRDGDAWLLNGSRAVVPVVSWCRRKTRTATRRCSWSTPVCPGSRVRRSMSACWASEPRTLD
jgi:alkylation response protein AidB-like acyl-CoA dehydrogenase